MGVPRVWEKMQEKMKSAGAKSSTVRRKVAAWAKDVGLQTNLAKMNQYVHILSTCFGSVFDCMLFFLLVLPSYIRWQEYCQSMMCVSRQPERPTISSHIACLVYLLNTGFLRACLSCCTKSHAIDAVH